ncbi:hypothetical protein H0H92_011264 [Tricholoma furcatifolium]|nr:hypothetical protein H0H92_011264 [Tricholoma furcatifolium]
MKDGPEAQDNLFAHDTHVQPKLENVPQPLVRANLRLQFPPTYVLVGVYRFFTDKSLYIPAWDKCRHAARRGVIAGAIWANAAVLLVGSQVTNIIRFFLARNLNIARARVWDQTVASRGKGPDFWQPYVEEWDNPPVVSSEPVWETGIKRWFGEAAGLFIVRRVILLPFNFYPFVGILISAYFKSLRTAHIHHRLVGTLRTLLPRMCINIARKYFESKKMSKQQIAVFMEERKWDYRQFGLAAALLEGIPIIGLIFTISNRVGAAMWAHDLEKRQHYVATLKQAKRD